jgi:hypothetical protein
MSCGTCSEKTTAGAASAIGATLQAKSATGAAVTPDGKSAKPRRREPTVTRDDVKQAFPIATWQKYLEVTEKQNDDPCSDDDPLGKFEAALQHGRAWLAMDDMPLDSFMQHRRSPVNAWQKKAYAWAMQHPRKRLLVSTKEKYWVIFKHGEYVKFYLPDQGHEYITRDGRAKYHVYER